MLGYWKKEPVALIPAHHPDKKDKNFEIEEIEVDEDASIARLIDPSTEPLAEIREICEVNDISFSWVTGLSPKGYRAMFSNEDPVEKAIDHFIAMRSMGTTTAQYRKQFKKLIDKGAIHPHSSVEDYKMQMLRIEGDALKMSAASTNMQIYYMLQSFHAFLKDPSALQVRSSTDQYKHKRKGAMTDEEAERFFPALYQINPTYELIGRVLRYLNYDTLLEEQNGEKVNASVIPLESLLRLQSHDVRDSCVTLYANALDGMSMWGLYLPDDLYSRVWQLAQVTDVFVFRNKFGGPLDPGQIRRKFFEASKLAKLSRVISPIHLR
jgi:hypothetical protein